MPDAAGVSRQKLRKLPHREPVRASKQVAINLASSLNGFTLPVAGWLARQPLPP
jgi:hypothetical protein